MKKKSLKGFTLVECIVAMAIMGIASLLMVQVYGTVAKMNSDNNRMNNSLEVQMKYAEDQITADGSDVKVTKIPSYGTGTTTVDPVKFTITNESRTRLGASSFKLKTETADIELYVIGSDTSTDEKAIKYDDNNVRYKFILPKDYDAQKGSGS